MLDGKKPYKTEEEKKIYTRCVGMHLPGNNPTGKAWSLDCSGEQDRLWSVYLDEYTEAAETFVTPQHIDFLFAAHIDGVLQEEYIKFKTALLNKQEYSYTPKTKLNTISAKSNVPHKAKFTLRYDAPLLEGVVAGAWN